MENVFKRFYVARMCHAQDSEGTALFRNMKYFAEKDKRNGEGHSVRYSGSHESAALSSKRCDCTLEEVRRSWVRAYANAMHKGTREALQLIIFALRHLVFTPAATFAPTILHLIFQKSSSLIRI